MAKKLALQQGLRQGTTVDRDKWPIFPGTLVVDGLGNEFLARTRWACNQNRGLGLGHLANNIIDLEHGFTLAYYVTIPETI